MCVQLSDVAVVGMGDESKKVFLTLNEIRWRGNPYWWLSVYQCRACQQSWLVAQEERHNDVFCLYRPDRVTMQDVLNLDIGLAEELARKAVREDQVHISFDGVK